MRVLLFGTTGLAIVMAAALGAQTPAPPAAPSGNVENGKKLFRHYGCWTCHDYDAHGGAGSGPRLAGRNLPWPGFSKSVRTPAEEMVPFTTKVLPDQDLADIYAWVRSLPPPPPVGSIPSIKQDNR